MRIGHGYDVHRFSDGRRLILGGVEIPYEKGLLGHSDADVLLHAIMDALLGAAGLGDIGRMFPDTDAAFLNISSITLLCKVMEALYGRGYSVVNIDATIVAQRPKLSDYLPAMCSSISDAMGIHIDQVNMKATTEEGLGFTGAMQGIAAHAVVLIKKD